MKIACYGFAGTSLIFKKLQNEMKEHQFYFILPSYHYLDQFSQERKDNRLLYVFGQFNDTLKNQDTNLRPFIHDSQDQVINIDKERGYFQLSTETRQKVINTYWDIYKDFLVNNKIDLVVFPDIETVDGAILMNVCKSLGIEVAYYVANRLFGGAFWAQDQYESHSRYFENDPSLESSKKAEQFIEKFKSTRKGEPFAVPQSSLIVPTKGEIKKWFLFFKNRYGTEKYRRDEDSSLSMKIKMKVAKHLNRFRKWRFDSFQRNIFHSSLPKEKFIAYFLQYTPESSINGLCPYFVDQKRAIEALLFSLPKHTKLVVKEHPGMVGIRPVEFYDDLKSHLSLHLLSPEVPSQLVIQESLVVATVTGTVGLEAFLLDKPCIQFGPNFFAHLNKKYKGLEDLKNWLSQIADGKWQPPNHQDKVKEVAKFYEVSQPFFIFEPSFSRGCLDDKNIRNIAESLRLHFSKLGNKHAN